jgi:hypothetical protein
LGGAVWCGGVIEPPSRHGWDPLRLADSYRNELNESLRASGGLLAFVGSFLGFQKRQPARRG